MKLSSSTDTDNQAELQALAAESMGWQPLSAGVYLHHGDASASANGEEEVILVVGLPDMALAGFNVLLLT